MRRIATLLVATVLLVAACGTAAGPTPSPQSARPTTTPSPTAAPSPTAGYSTATAEVVFDGKSCTYRGPAVVPSVTRMTFDLRTSESDVIFVVAAVVAGTTWEEYRNWNGSGSPPFIIVAGGTLVRHDGPGSATVDLRDLANAHAWGVSCVRHIDAADQANFAAALIEVVNP